MSSAQVFIFSVISSILVMSALTLYILPDISEELNAPLSQEEEQEILSEDQGIVIQSKYQTWDSRAVLDDSSTSSYAQIPDTSLSITIQAQSRIAAVFMSDYWLRLEDLPAGDELRYNISLAVEGVGNESIVVNYYDSVSLTIKEISSTLYIDYVTASLPAGTYTVSVWWMSELNQFDLNSLRLSDTNEPHTRSLWVQELKGA
ncbi:MAG: hypothetical protein ACFFGZ_19875 [Candidatus Thorarchaeota archaeon]